MKLSHSILKQYHNKRHDKPFELADRDSISISVSAKGKMVWQFSHRYNNKADHLRFGHCPNVSLGDARKGVPELKGLLFDGKNPKLEWQQIKIRLKRNLRG